MKEVGKILPSIFKKRGRLNEKTVVELLAPLWSRVAGKPIAGHSRPATFEAGTLTLISNCPSWAGQLQNMAEDIRTEVNRFLGEPVVKKLQVRQVPEVSELVAPARSSSEKRAVDHCEVRISDFDFRSELDPETAQIIERSFKKYFARKATNPEGAN